MTKTEEATVRLLDMLYNARPDEVPMRTLYSAVQRTLEPVEFEVILEQMVASGKVAQDHNEDPRIRRRHYRWIAEEKEES